MNDSNEVAVWARVISRRRALMHIGQVGGVVVAAAVGGSLGLRGRSSSAAPTGAYGRGPMPGKAK